MADSNKETPLERLIRFVCMKMNSPFIDKAIKKEFSELGHKLLNEDGWTENKQENWPDESDADLYLFVTFTLGKNDKVITVTDYYGTFESAKYFRKCDLYCELGTGYTHFKKILPPVIEKKEPKKDNSNWRGFKN